MAPSPRTAVPLVITATRQPAENPYPVYYGGNAEWTSAKLTTYNKVGFKYGRIEARMKMPQGIGTWPAFWMLGGDLLEGASWPECGEIDVMEFRGDISDRSTGALHGPNTPAGSGLGTAFLSYAPLSDDYHTYAIEWRKNAIDFIVDGSITGTYTSADTGARGWVFNQKFFLILNLAVGGTYAGEDIDPDLNQAEFKIDFDKFLVSKNSRSLQFTK